MNLLIRFFVIALGFLAACFVANVVVFAAWLMPELLDASLDPIDRSTMNFMLGIGVLVVSGFSLLPALIVILLTEAFSIRNVLIYAVGGGLAGLVCYLAFIPFDTATMVFEGVVRRHLEIMIGGGIVAGLVYWLIAGRNAGRWREPEVLALSPRSQPPSAPL